MAQNFFKPFGQEMLYGMTFVNQYSRLLITLPLANSNLALTRTKVDFPWISFLHLL